MKIVRSRYFREESHDFNIWRAESDFELGDDRNVKY